MKAVTYKGYLIRARSNESPPAGWTAYAFVSWDEGADRVEQKLPCDKIFKTPEDADDYAVEMSKAWIDDQ